MRKVAPSVLVGEHLDRLLADGADEGTNLISEVVAAFTRLVVQSLLEGEQGDFWVGVAGITLVTTRWGIGGGATAMRTGPSAPAKAGLG